jgi:hypothetical protein
MKKTCLSVVLIFLLPAGLFAQQPRFIRLKEDGDKVMSLEIAISRYTNKSKTVTVDLVGVVHVADRAYYDQLSKRFPSYDVVLYELVAPQGTRVPRGGKKDGLSGFITGLMTSVLDLDSQLNAIDYHQKNFVHADLSFDGMMEAAKARGESGLTLGLSVLSDLFRQQNKGTAKKKKDDEAPEDLDILTALASPVLLKRQMARQMVDNLELGPTLQNLLVADRNKKTCEVLADEISDGKTKIAIFYGAAHMPDFDRRLREEFGLRQEKQEWLTAWNLSGSAGDPTQRLKSLFEKALQGK